MEIGFTDRQLDVMNILWEEGDATVREAKEQIEEDLAYTSVLTVFQTLDEKGHVDYEKEGKAYRYYPTVSREEVGQKAAGYILRRVFAGSSSEFLDALADQGAVPDETAEDIRDLAVWMRGCRVR